MKTRTLLSLATLLTLAADPAQAVASDTVLTYQGRVRANGMDFTGTGQFKFAVVTATNTASGATATANPPSGGFIIAILVTDGGSGYVTAPTVTISGGGGLGATATTSISDGKVTAITIGDPGSGYNEAPSVTIAPPPEKVIYSTHWSNDGTSTAGSEPEAAVGVPVTEGLFTVGLGDTSLVHMDAFPPNLFERADLRLRIWFNDGVNGHAALSPPQRLTVAPYAILASSAINLLGTVPAAALSGTYTGAVAFNNAGNSFSGKASGLTELNADALTGGTVPEARLLVATATNNGALGSNDFRLISVRSRVFDNVVPTAPMGMCTWVRLGFNLTESNLLFAASNMCALGAVRAGYDMIQIDEGWCGQITNPATAYQLDGKWYNTIEALRDGDGTLLPDTNKFEHTIPWIVDYLRTNYGMKLGMYMSAGSNALALTVGDPPTNYTRNCSSGYRPGQLYTDAKKWASCGVAYLKICFDDWTTPLSEQKPRAMEVLRGMQDSGKPCYASLIQNEYGTNDYLGAEHDLTWMSSDIQLLNIRTLGENGRGIVDRTMGAHLWSPESAEHLTNEWRRLDMFCRRKRHLLGPGHYALPEWTPATADGDVTRTLFGNALLMNAANIQLWFSWQSISIQTNEEALAMIKDNLGRPAFCVKTNGLSEVWVKPYISDSGLIKHVGLINKNTDTNSAPASISFTWDEIGLNPWAITQVRDVWFRTNIQVTTSLAVDVPFGQVRLFKVSQQDSTASPSALLLSENRDPPPGNAEGGYFWNSNKVLFWVTSTRTNVVSDGR